MSYIGISRARNSFYKLTVGQRLFRYAESKQAFITTLGESNQVTISQCDLRGQFSISREGVWLKRGQESKPVYLSKENLRLTELSDQTRKAARLVEMLL